MSRQIRCTAAAVGLLVCGTPAGALRAQATDRAAVVARVDSIVRNAVTPLAPGYSVAVVRGRDTVLWKGYGSANLELSVPASVNTVYRIGSITKQFTAAAVLQLVEQSKLHLDDPVARHLPNAPAHWQPVRVRHLLNHTSGIPSFTELGGRMRTAYLTGLSGDSMVGLVRGDSLMFAPGTGFFYNNTAYYLLGRIIERVSGKSYATYVTEHLTKPLGLSRTTYCSNRLILEGRASGYEPQDGALVNSRALDMDVPFSAGALCSTVGDLTTWTRALASGRVVRPDSYQQMTSPAALPSVYPMTWGYGVHVDTAGTHRVLGHSGGIYGFTGQLSHYPEDSLIVVVLANSSAAPTGRLAADIARSLLGVPRMPVATRTLPTTVEERASLVGRYLLAQVDGTRQEIAVVEQEGKLALRFPGQAPLILERQGEHVFALERDANARVWIERRGAQVTGLILDRGGRPLPARRLT
jgi:CubicO group peptidase (beta-lactamase class C family)